MDEALPRSRRRWFKIGKLLGAVVTLGILVPLLGFVLESRRIDKKLRAAIAEADRDDPNWRIQDLFSHRIAIPDSENSGLVAAEAIDGLPKGWPADPRGRPDIPKPPPSELSKAHDALAGLPANVLLPHRIGKPLRQALAKLEPNVVEARRLAEYPRGSYRLTMTRNPLDIPLEHDQDARALARLLSVDALLRANEGDADGAIESCLARINTGRSVGDEPTLISQLVRTAIVLSALDTIVRVLGVSEPSDKALSELQSLIEDELEEPTFLQGLKGERSILEDVLHKLETGELDSKELSDDANSNPMTQRGLFTPWIRLTCRENRATGLEWMNEAIRIARTPLWEQSPAWDAWEARIDRTRKKGYISAQGAWIAMLLMPAVRQCHESATWKDLSLRTMVALIAAERSRLKTGHWPERLEEIEEAILPNVPMDPLSGNPILLLHRDGRLFAYSVGFNKMDDHAAFAPKPRAKGPFDYGYFAWDSDQRKLHPANESDNAK